MKWIIVLTMPSGSRWCLAPDPKGSIDSIALFPIAAFQPTALKGVWGFETEAKAKEWIDETAKMSEQGAKLMAQCQPFLADSLQ